MCVYIYICLVGMSPDMSNMDNKIATEAKWWDCRAIASIGYVSLLSCGITILARFPVCSPAAMWRHARLHQVFTVVSTIATKISPLDRSAITSIPCLPTCTAMAWGSTSPKGDRNRVASFSPLALYQLKVGSYPPMPHAQWLIPNNQCPIRRQNFPAGTSSMLNP